MPTVNKTLLVPFTPQQMYDLINDIAAYPDFLPWCKSATVHASSEQSLEATLCLSKGPVVHYITTRNSMQPHSRIDMEYKAGPFKSCTGSWLFETPVVTPETQQCRIIFNFNYEFANKFVGLALEPVFKPISNSLIDAFYQRAVAVYGNNK